jgi:uncharacterized protein
MKPEPLAETDFDRMSDILELFGGKRSMNLEQIDGFLAAVVCGPEAIPQPEYLRVIWGDDIVNEDAFSSKPALKEFISLVTRHHDFIAHTLQSGDVVLPLLALDEDGIARGNDWAAGFMQGMALRSEGWSELLDDDDHGGSLVPILALAHELHPDLAMRPYKDP